MDDIQVIEYSRHLFFLYSLSHNTRLFPKAENSAHFLTLVSVLTPPSIKNT